MGAASTEAPRAMTSLQEEDEVENTFRKLYRKYVTDSEPDLSKKDKDEESLAEKSEGNGCVLRERMVSVTRRFESKSEAEDEDSSISEEDEDEILTKYQAKGLRRVSFFKELLNSKTKKNQF